MQCVHKKKEWEGKGREEKDITHTDNMDLHNASQKYGSATLVAETLTL